MRLSHRSGKWALLPFCLLVSLIITLIFGAGSVSAQDSVSTADVVFAPSQPVKKTEQVTVKESKPRAINKRQQQQSLLAIFIAGLFGGLAALLMPCIFPMVPMTVSYFTKGSVDNRNGVGKAIIYGISIIVIYVVFGLVITLAFGPDALNSLSTNGVFNFAFFYCWSLFPHPFLAHLKLPCPVNG